MNSVVIINGDGEGCDSRKPGSTSWVVDDGEVPHRHRRHRACTDFGEDRRILVQEPMGECGALWCI